jgi:hypothetical protein
MRAVVFAGPSLPPHVRPSLPGVEWRPPVQQGGIYRAALTRPALIAVVDGYFEVTPTVWHKEILWAMAQGIHVYGAASIGALRAAELDAFGMKGVGRIYEMYRDGVLQDDDEVAVLHGPEELGYPRITEAMVDVRATIEQGVQCGMISDEVGGELTLIAKKQFYKSRTYEEIAATACARGLGDLFLRAFLAWVPAGRVDQKQLDAAAMLDVINELLAGELQPLRVDYDFVSTAAWALAIR